MALSRPRCSLHELIRADAFMCGARPEEYGGLSRMVALSRDTGQGSAPKGRRDGLILLFAGPVRRRSGERTGLLPGLIPVLLPGSMRGIPGI